MNIGELRERIEVLEFVPIEGGYAWQATRKIWGLMEESTAKNLFSSLGVGAKNVDFVVRRQNIDQHHALMLKGVHYFITDVVPIDMRLSKISCAVTRPVICVIERTLPEYNELGNPVVGVATQITFPACIVEKYTGYSLQKASSESEHRLIMVVSKTITADIGELVQALCGVYEIRACHTLDPYKNEYEMTAKEDV